MEEKEQYFSVACRGVQVPEMEINVKYKYFKTVLYMYLVTFHHWLFLPGECAVIQCLNVSPHMKS